MTYAIDFDGTLADHDYPDIGREVPHAFEWLKRLQEAGVRLILWTMRSDTGGDGETLTQAVEWCRERGVEFWGVNRNPEQSSWTSSPKAYAQRYVDDSAFGCPLARVPGFNRPCVDWAVVGPALLELLANGRGHR